MSNILNAICCCVVGLMIMATCNDFDGGPAPIAAEEYEYVFQLDLTPLLGIVRDGKCWLGHLNDSGDFVPDHSEHLPQGFKAGQPFSSVSLFTFLNFPKIITGESVFEFRSGRLIKGVLHQDGRFVPDVDSKVIDLKDYLKDYRPGPGEVRIYNLPGRLALKKKPDPALPKP
jgi:hypothetical protein